MKDARKSWWLWVAMVASLALVCVVDCVVQPEAAVSLAYVLPVLLSLRLASRRTTIVIAGIATLLIGLGFFLSNARLEPSAQLVNRSLSMLACWTLVLVSIQRTDAADRVLRQRFELAVRGANDGLWDWDLLTNEVWYAPRFRELLKYDGHDETNFPARLDSFRRHLHPDDQQATWDAIQRHLEQDERYDVQYRLRLRNGQYRWFRARGACVRDESGKALRMAGSIQDIQSLRETTDSLRQAERRLHQAMTNGNIGLWDWDVPTNVVYFSPQAKVQLGYDADDDWPSYLDWESRLHPDDREQAVSVVRDYLERRVGEYVSIFRLRARSGDYHWIQSQGEAEWDDEGQPLRMIGVHVDITPQRVLDQKLRGTEQQFREFAEHLDGIVWMFRLPGFELEYVSPAYEKIAGQQRERLAKSPLAWMDLIHPEDRQRVETAFRAQAEGADYSQEFRLVVSGRVRWIWDRGVLVRDEDGALIRAVGIAQDITDRKLHEERLQQMAVDLSRANAELAREQFLLNSLVENIPDPIFFKDRDGRFLRVNQRMARDVGVANPRELIGKTDAEVWGGDLWRETDEDEREILRTGMPLINKEERPISRDGRERWVLVTKMLLRDESGQIVGTFGVARDITERKHHEQELQRINVELERSNQELENFAYVASHDLRTPLRNIDSLTQWIAEDAGDSMSEQSRADLDLLRQRVELMNNLLSDLLQYSRVGRVESGSEIVQPSEVIREVVELLAPPQGFDVVWTEDLPAVRAPRTALRKVFQNLIDNAIKHHDRAEGRVEIAGCLDGDMAEFTVRDDGPGIDPRFHEKIFQIFQTLKGRDELAASGMGLAIVKKTIEAYGGRVRVESTEGAGATFRFTWPRE